MSPLERFRYLRDLSPTSIGPQGKLILFALASRANDIGVCYPSYRKLARDTGLAPRSIGRHMAALVDAGLIVRQRRFKRSYIYRLALEEFAATYPQAAHRLEDQYPDSDALN